MEARYAAVAERQRVVLKQAVAKEETRAAHLADPLERRRGPSGPRSFWNSNRRCSRTRRSYATNSGVSIQEQTSLKDKTVTDFEELKKLLDDGSVSPLDALRLKNDFRRIGPERAQVVRTDLAESEAELTRYENALTDAEIDLVNDSRDDRFDRESLLEQLPANRRAEANAMLEDLETRHRALLNRRRNVLQQPGQLRRGGTRLRPQANPDARRAIRVHPHAYLLDQGRRAAGSRRRWPTPGTTRSAPPRLWSTWRWNRPTDRSGPAPRR